MGNRLDLARLATVALLVVAAACASEGQVTSGAGPATSTTTEADGATNDTDGESDDPSTDDSGGEDTTTTAAASPAEPTTSPALYTHGEIAIPEGEPGQLSIVLVGEIDDSSSAPVVVRNRTDGALSRIEVSGTARGPDGALVGSGSSQGIEPAVLEPGEWGIGYVYFGVDRGTTGLNLDLTASGRPARDELFAAVVVPVVEATWQPGEFGDRIVGIVENRSSDAVSGPISVTVMCFAEGTPTNQTRTFTDGDDIIAGGTASFTADFYGSTNCPAWAVGASGWSD